MVNLVSADGPASPLTPWVGSSLCRGRAIDATGITDRFDFSLDRSQEDYQFALMRAAVNNGVVLPPQVRRFLDAAPSNVLG